MAAETYGYPVPNPAPAPVPAGYPAPAPTVPPPVQFNAVPMGAWSTGCCACFDDMEACCCAFWCPCVSFGRVAEIVTDGNVAMEEACALWALVAFCIGAGCVYSFGFRTKLRAKYNLPGDTINDLLLHWCCGCCSFSQEYRELKNRGWIPSDGYKANITRFQMGNSGMPPLNTAPENQFMSK
ncbi:hypothetical protein CLOM_g15551 [Closterium sp. NIES-68]|nr:hypothetical protein CLOM_g15551 [Closterium sp. NIES-68]GJP79521.1 hypothetical protein CLOP_g9747 [Closterium sp. NIES-67]